MDQYVAFLRGINVGGNNIIKMADLRTCFEKAGFEEVATFIQTGNVLFASAEQDVKKLTQKIEKALFETFGYSAWVTLRTFGQMQATVAAAPKRFGDDPKTYRYDVIFLRDTTAPAEAIKSITTKEGVDQVAAGPNALYFSRLISKATQSHIARLITLPVYKHMTIRNWNTTSRILALMEAR